MIGLSLKHLRYFDALARSGHFGRAAESCAISQPALSLQIKDLEGLIGAPLVERGGRQIRLTPLGEELAQRTGAILRSIDELADLGRSAQANLTGRVRLGVIPTAAPYLLPGVMKALTELYPTLDLRPREAVTQRLIEELSDAKLDAAIVALPVSEPTLREVPLFEEEFLLVRPVGDRDKPPPAIERLHEMRLLLLQEGHCFRDQALSVCKIEGALPRDLIEGSSLSTLVQMVGAGIGVTLIPQMAIGAEAHAPTVHVTRLAEPRPTRTIGMIWRKTNPLSEQFSKIAEVVREVGVNRKAGIERLRIPGSGG